MTISGFFRFWKRFFRNRSSATFIFNPYAATETTADGKIRRQRPKVAYVQILYDLFIVAALQIFSRETALVTGDQIASFIAFFTIMWAIWASQSLFDLHFRSGHDLFSLFFLLLQLCMFGGLASIGAGFNIATGILHFEHNLPQGVYQWVVPAEPELIDENDRKRAVQAASAIYAISRFILITQYAIVTVQARRRKCEIRPMLMVIAGLFISAAMWLGALGCDAHDGKGWAIARVCLWITGVLCEFGFTFWALQYEAHFEEDAEFFLERFNALTIIIIGEGVFGLFEGFSIVIQGPQETIDPSIIGVLCAAICMYLSLYYLYFGHKLETFRSFTGSKLVWGFMHYPMHLCLLLTFQAINYNIQCIATMDPVDNALTSGILLTFGLMDLYEANNNVSVSEMLNFTKSSDNGTTMAAFATRLGIDWNSTLDIGAYLVSGNSTKFFQYVNSQTYSLYARLYSLARFKPTPGTFYALDRLAQLGFDASGDSFNNYYQHGFYRLIKLTYEASLFGFAAIGGYVLILAMLQWVQTPKMTKFTTISIAWKVIIGVTSICMEALTHKGFTFAGWNSDDQQDNLSMMSDLITNTVAFIPAMLAVSLPVILVDSAMYLWRHALLDAERSLSSSSHSPEDLDDKHGFLRDHDSSKASSRGILQHSQNSG